VREFNVTGLCIPGKHYMVDISEKVRQTAAMVEKGQYFTINRARQYGKTTTIRQLEKVLLEKGYLVARISFEGIGDTPFENEENFCLNLLRQISETFDMCSIKDYKLWCDKTITSFYKLNVFLDKMCKDKKVVLIIDETDKTSNNLVFLRFIGMLRDKYLERESPKKATFQSVILAGVYDIKNLKLKMIQAGTHELQDGEKRINSPWNIAADFEVDMSFSAPEIATMLNEYEKDHQTGMDIKAISEEIRAYTSGYPYLVSRLCKIIDEKLGKDWTLDGIHNAVKLILEENSTLFDDIIKNMESSKELFDLLHNIIISGESFIYNNFNPVIRLGVMFGILSNENRVLAIHNRIFELFICEYFISLKDTDPQKSRAGTIISEIIENGKFDMALAIKKFMQHYYELYNKSNEEFLESECRLLFLTYLRPLINGAGFYHIESETRNLRRTDLIVDYGTEQFIVEMKIWHGEQKHEKAYEQLIEYLNSKNKSEGYLLTFDFRKRRAKKPSAKWVRKGKKKFLDCLCV
jgi:hypothetical protein